MVGDTGIEPVVPEAADLQSAESPLILLPHKLGCLGWARTSDQMINSHLLYQLSYKAILERDIRIELMTKGWKPVVLPLN